MSEKQFESVFNALLLLSAAHFFSELDFPDNLDASTNYLAKAGLLAGGLLLWQFRTGQKKIIKSIYKTQNGQTDYSLAGKPHPLEAVDQALCLAASLLEYRWKNWLWKHFSRPQLSRRRDPKRCWRIFPW